MPYKDKEKQREQRRLESVRQAAGRLEEDVEELEAIASLATGGFLFYGNRK
jgi:hypothetical protein